MFCVFEIIAFELGVANSPNLQQDTGDRWSMCYETPLIFYLTLGETFPKSIFLRIMKKYDKGALMDILQVFGTLSHVDCQSVFRNGAFYRKV